MFRLPASLSPNILSLTYLNNVYICVTSCVLVLKRDKFVVKIPKLNECVADRHNTDAEVSLRLILVKYCLVY